MYQLFAKKKKMLGQYRGTLALQLLNLVQHNTFFNIKDHLAPLINKKIQPVVLVEKFHLG